MFNNNPAHIQLFRAVPLAVDRTRFETWELQYDPQGDAEYLEAVNKHWERLKVVVAEDVEIYGEVSAARGSSAYKRNIFNDHECKITHFHAGRAADARRVSVVTEDALQQLLDRAAIVEAVAAYCRLRGPEPARGADRGVRRRTAG